ncbi:MAG: hypothetical protein ISR83_07245 [Candidatus Marinimicrobia bacterium]|nr:hypothetical protein [Candidatus Neomarinimicrobiota bacterium]
MKYFLLILHLALLPLTGQENELTLERKKLIILPADSGPESMGQKITNIVSGEAVQLGRFDIIDRSHLEAILEEQKLHLSGLIDENQVVEIGEMAAAEEALFIKIIAYNQKGVPPKEKVKKKEKDEEDDSLFEWIVKETVTAVIDEKLEGVERYPYNIQTTIQAEVRLINIKTGKSKHSFKLYGHYTGGTKAESFTRALRSMRWQIRTKLKTLYILSSEIVELNGKEITILSGKNLGLRKGAIFEIASNDRKKTYKGKSITIPGKPRGLARITEVGPDASIAKIVRKWRPIKEGNKAYEIISSPSVNELAFSYNESPGMQMMIQHWINPFAPFSMSVSGQIGTFTDSRNETTGQFGFGFGFGYKLFQLGPIGNALRFHIPIDFALKSDDADHLASATILSPMIGWETSILIGKSKDLVISVFTIPKSTFGEWTYTEQSDSDSEESTTVDAFWNGEAPTVDLTGLFLSVGIRFINIR